MIAHERAEALADLLDLVMDSFARIDPRCAALLRSVVENRETAPADVEWLTGSAGQHDRHYRFSSPDASRL